MPERFLARHTTASLEQLVAGKRGVIALVPVGSTEPHGPHLGLGTDVVISAAACLRAAELLEKRGTMIGVIAPAISYGVTDCAHGFAGAVSIPAGVLTAYIAAVCATSVSSTITSSRRTTPRCALRSRAARRRSRARVHSRRSGRARCPPSS